MARVFGCTYEEMNTILFLYGQPIILAVVCCISLGYICYSFVRKYTLVKLIYLIVYSGILYAHVPLIRWFDKTYWRMDMHTACEVCIKDMYAFGGGTQNGYIWVNIIIFIFGFLAVLCINAIPLYAKALRE